jgi:hypothetical protein
MLEGKDKLLPRVMDVKICSDYHLILTFTNGERRDFDAASLFDIPFYKDLKKVFNYARVAYGTIVWPSDIDISPDTLYLKSTPIV